MPNFKHDQNVSTGHGILHFPSLFPISLFPISLFPISLFPITATSSLEPSERFIGQRYHSLRLRQFVTLSLFRFVFFLVVGFTYPKT